MATDVELVPNANSPQLLTQLIELVARGVRSSRALQEGLGLDPRTVRYYCHAGEWLGLMDRDARPSLTPLGVEYAYAGRNRARVYAAAAWAVPLVDKLMAGHTELPHADDIAAVLVEEYPALAPSTARRRASAVRSLLAPALSLRGRSRLDPQVDLPLVPSTPSLSPPAPMHTSSEHDPGLYRYILGALVDHGELSLGHIRALLDRAGATDAPIGGYVELATTRGDAMRVNERLVVTREAVRWQDLVESTPSIVLSDPGYRRWLDDLTADDAVSQARRRKKAARYEPWDKRLFGAVAKAEDLDEQLGGLLLERGLATWPCRGDGGLPLTQLDQPFLTVWEHAGLAIGMPPYLGALRRGLPYVNRTLREARGGQVRVGLPLPTERPEVVHAGVLHPGERLPRSVPDVRSLRIRLVRNAPYVSLIAALLSAHRVDPRVELVRRNEGWVVRHGRQVRGPLLEVLDDFAQQRGWVCCRRTRGGLPAQELLETLAALGIVILVGTHAVLDEAFFTALRSEPEEEQLAIELDPLRDALLAALSAPSP